MNYRQLIYVDHGVSNVGFAQILGNGVGKRALARAWRTMKHQYFDVFHGVKVAIRLGCLETGAEVVPCFSNRVGAGSAAIEGCLGKRLSKPSLATAKAERLEVLVRKAAHTVAEAITHHDVVISGALSNELRLDCGKKLFLCEAGSGTGSVRCVTDCGPRTQVRFLR